MPQPEVLGPNGTFLAVRKLHTKAAAWRQYLRANTTSPEQEALLRAKMIGRWPSGAPLTLSPDQDDPALGTNPRRNNDFLYQKTTTAASSVPRRTYPARQPA
jgi:deferrochelatase/peroxidase EfeB